MKPSRWNQLLLVIKQLDTSLGALKEQAHPTSLFIKAQVSYAIGNSGPITTRLPLPQPDSGKPLQYIVIWYALKIELSRQDSHVVTKKYF